jgi:outer membrane lipoprotein-sorting protein
MQIRSAIRSLGIAVLIVSISGCLVRTRTLDKRQVNTSNLLVADLPQLVERINSEARKVHSFSATVEIATALGGTKKGKVTEIQQIKGYILEKDPDMLHVIGLLPIVRSRAFDMVSDGKTFKLSIPPMNKFIVGPAEEPAQPSTTNTLENLRPSVFFDSLLLHEIGPNEVAVLEQGTDVVQDTTNKKKSWELPTYIVNVILHEDGTWRLERKIAFSRIDLKPHRQMIYDRNGAVATEAEYNNFADFQGVIFPSQIKINRPKEEYSIQIMIEKIEVNKPLTDDQFSLAQPPGAQVKVLK